MVYRPNQWLSLRPNLSGSFALDTIEWGRAQTPHSTQVHTGSGIDLRWFGTLHFPSYDSQRIPLITKGDFLVTDQRAYQFYCRYDNQRLGISLADGTTNEATAAIPDVSDGKFIGLRVTWRNSDGRIQFFYSLDNGVNWTQIGSNVTGSVSPYTIPNRGIVFIGRDFFSAFTGHWGKTARAEIRNAPDGTIIASPDFSNPSQWTVGETQSDTANDTQGNTWTLVRDTGNIDNDGQYTAVEITDREVVQYLELNQGANNDDEASIADDPVFDGFTRLTISALIRPDQISSGASQTILSRARNGDTGLHISFIIHPDGKLFAEFRDIGGTARSGTSDVSLDTVYNDGDWFWVRVEMNPTTDTIQFFISDDTILDGDPIDPSHWIARQFKEQFGSTINITGAANGIEDSDQAWHIGQRYGVSGSDLPFRGRINFVQIAGQTTNLGAVPDFGDSGPWQVGDDSTTPGSRNELDNDVAVTLLNAAEIKEQFAYWGPDEQGGLKFGSTTSVEIDLQSDAIGGLIFGAPFNVNPRIAGEARGELVIGGRFPQRYDQVMSGGLVLGSNFTIIPPEIVSGIGATWNVGIGGIGYMLSTLDQEAPFEYRSYEIQAIPQQRPQIDDQDEPGEQTLFPWWSRAQHTWHEGAGQEIFDSPFSSRYRYCSSIGLNPWDTGEIKLLKDTALLAPFAAISDVHLLGAENALFYTHDGNVVRDVDPDTAGVDTLATHDGTPINSITSDGEVLYAAFSGGSLGIKSTPLEGTLAWSDVNAQTDVDLIAFVKGRLIGAKGPSLYEYDLAVTTAPEAFYNDVASTWVWTAISESGPAIYASGYAGERSEIYAVRLTAQDVPVLSSATLGAPVSVWTAPDGERVLSVKGYVGAQLLIGTSRGVRIGVVIPGSGELQVSPLLSETRDDHPRPLNVLSFEPQDDYAWFTWTNYDGTHTGLGRIHLGSLGWSSDLMYSGQGEVRNVVTYNGRRYFTVFDDPDSAVVKEHPTDLVETAQLDLCEIRFGTSELKILRYFDFRGRGEGTYAVRISKDGEVFNPVINTQGVSAYRESVINVEGSSFKLRLLITRDSDPLQQFFMNEWRLRAEPRSTGRFRYFVPLMIFDHMLNAAETEIGHIGYALQQLEALIDLYRTGRDTLFQRLGTGVPGGPTPTLVIMEDLRFKSFTPPQGARGFGGVALAILREVR